MNGWLLASATLCVVGYVGHVIDGERRFLPPYLRAGVVVYGDAAYTAGTLRLAWHVWGLAYAAFAVLLGYAAVRGLPSLVPWTLAGLFATCGLLSAPLIRRFHPAQVLFGVLAVTTGAGAWLAPTM